jgi:hypothetical protein
MHFAAFFPACHPQRRGAEQVAQRCHHRIRRCPAQHSAGSAEEEGQISRSRDQRCFSTPPQARKYSGRRGRIVHHSSVPLSRGLFTGSLLLISSLACFRECVAAQGGLRWSHPRALRAERLHLQRGRFLGRSRPYFRRAGAVLGISAAFAPQRCSAAQLTSTLAFLDLRIFLGTGLDGPRWDPKCMAFPLTPLAYDRAPHLN